MNLTYQERQELNELSKKVFGTSSKWKKLITTGFPELFTREREVMVPKANGQAVKKVFVDKKYVTKYYSVEEVKKLMLDELKSREEQIKTISEAQVKAEAVETPTTESSAENPTA